jgi:hypothetical protein
MIWSGVSVEYSCVWFIFGWVDWIFFWLTEVVLSLDVSSLWIDEHLLYEYAKNTISVDML